MKDSIFLILILVLALVPPIYSKMTESFKNKKESFTLGSTDGIYPCSQTNVLVQDTYPITGINSVSNETGAKMWWRYPIFQVGSFKQMTNNAPIYKFYGPAVFAPPDSISISKFSIQKCFILYFFKRFLLKFIQSKLFFYFI